jgi:predicted SnoaL-like aldol condensation-catalyzing enzyme
VTTSDTLGATVRQAMIDIFRKKDTTSVDRYVDESFIQHDPNLADGLAGIKSFAAEVASSPAADITIYRMLVDGSFVLLHSRYEGVRCYGGSVIAFDLFRLNDGEIVEHWGGQEPEAPPNQSGRTQVDGPTDVVDREKTEANRALVRSYRDTVLLALRFDRIKVFIDDAHYAQHASKIGDGNCPLKGTDCERSQGGRTAQHQLPSIRGRWQLCPCYIGGRSTFRAYRALRSFSGR